MNFSDLCKQRFSVRKFSQEQVDKTDLDYILECVRLAPSAVNFQPWKFIVVESDEALAKLQQCYDRDWFKTAPVAVIAYKNTDEEWVRKCDEKPHGDVDVAIAVEHLCLAATERNLGTCWICNFDVKRLEALFPQPDNLIPVAIVPIGHIAQDCPVKEKSRKSMEQIVEFI